MHWKNWQLLPVLIPFGPSCLSVRLCSVLSDSVWFSIHSILPVFWVSRFEYCIVDIAEDFRGCLHHWRTEMHQHKLLRKRLADRRSLENNPQILRWASMDRCSLHLQFIDLSNLGGLQELVLDSLLLLEIYRWLPSCTPAVKRNMLTER